MGLGALAAGLAACAQAVRPAWIHPGTAAWDRAGEDLQKLRALAPSTPYIQSLGATIREPRSGKVFFGRGAIAVAPGRALRMILVGMAGATLMDAWVTPQKWRFAVPPIDLVRRGGCDDPDDLPIGLLRSWFLEPFRGELAGAAPESSGMLWLLRSGDSAVELRRGACDGGDRVQMRRRQPKHVERIDVCRRAVGDTVRYADDTSGLVLNLVANPASTAPERAAFLDPDLPDTL
jgi:hypothetical protein